MIQGSWLPYVDGVSQRGPMLYWIVAVAQKLWDPYGWGGMRALGMLCLIATVAGSFVAGFANRLPLGGALG